MESSIKAMEAVVHSPVRARLIVSRTEAIPQITFAATKELHHFGVGDTQVFEFFQPLNPDDAWEIDRLMPSANLLSVTADQAANTVLENWLPSFLKKPATRLIAALPAGTYELAIARPTLDEKRGNQLLLGNEWVADCEVGQTIHQSPDLYAAIFNENSSLRFPTALVAVTILNYTGQSTPVATWFASFLTNDLSNDLSSDEDVDSTQQDQSLLIVPVEGPLVFDAAHAITGHDTAAERHRFLDRATDIVDALAIPDEEIDSN